MNRIALFLLLYVYSWCKLLRHWNQKKPIGLRASALGIFKDQYLPKELRKPHGIVVFVIPPGESFDKNYSANMSGPFGFTANIDWNNWHLYGIDTWGCLDPNNNRDANQIAANPFLFELYANSPAGSKFQLAGVRKLWRWHIWPLNEPSSYILPRK